MYRVKLSSYPNGENRLVLSVLPGARIPFPAHLSGCADSPEPIEGFPVSAPPPVTPPPLTLGLNSTNPPPKKSRSGNRSFTLAAKRKILRSAGALDKLDSAPSHKVFLTGTLPGGTEGAKAGIAFCAPKIVHSLRKWLAYQFPQLQHYFYCWELQKRGALHLHYCLYCPDPIARASIIAKFRSWWHDCLCGFSDKIGIDLFERAGGGTWRGQPEKIQADAQEVRFSVAAYVAKYCSKSAGTAFGGYAPPRWSSVSRPLGALLLESTEEVIRDFPSYTQAASSFRISKEELTSPEAVCYTYSHKVGAGVTHIAYYGKNIGDSQSCQFQKASQILISQTSAQSSPLPLWIASELFQFLELLPPPPPLSSPFKSSDLNPSLPLLVNFLPLILKALLGVSPSFQQVLGGKSLLRDLSQILSNFRTHTRISAFQKLQLKSLTPSLQRQEQKGHLLKRFPSLIPLVGLCRKRLTYPKKYDIRSTTRSVTVNRHEPGKMRSKLEAVSAFDFSPPPFPPASSEQLKFSL